MNGHIVAWKNALCLKSSLSSSEITSKQYALNLMASSLLTEREGTGALSPSWETRPVPNLPGNQIPWSDEGFLLAVQWIQSPDYFQSISDISLKSRALKAKSLSKINKNQNSCWFLLICLIIIVDCVLGIFSIAFTEINANLLAILPCV